jgi:hypothetical protein
MERSKQAEPPRRNKMWTFLAAAASALRSLRGRSAKQPPAPSSPAEVEAPRAGHPALEHVLAKITDAPTLLEVGSGWSAARIGSAAPLVEESVKILRDARSPFLDRLRAWQGLAMLFGDTGAPEICAILSLSAIGAALSSGATADELPPLLSKLHAHTNLALLDLGLVHQAGAGDPSTPNTNDFALWVRTDFPSLAKLDADAQLCLRFAAIRAGLLPRPDPFTLEAVRDLTL